MTEVQAMASEKKPKKGILKTSSSFDKDGHHDPSNKQAKWDEMNILATFHPPDKDYGHIKIDEPPTPYSTMEGEHMDEDTDEEEKTKLDPQNLADRLMDSSGPKVFEVTEDSSDDDNETEEDREKKKVFEQKRKLHYNEFQAVKLARQLLDEEDEREDEEKNTCEESEQTSL